MRALSLIFFTLFSFNLFASTEISTVGAGGYDLVEYFESSSAVKGSGNFIAYHDGTTYLFSSKKNKKTFEQNPQKYLPAFGGYCAMGVVFGRKLPIDPTAWDIVDDKLYFNLNDKVQKSWRRNIEGNIEKANKKWPELKDTPASELN